MLCRYRRFSLPSQADALLLVSVMAPHQRVLCRFDGCRLWRVLCRRDAWADALPPLSCWPPLRQMLCCQGRVGQVAVLADALPLWSIL
jgi:hypothetical protein